jgi:choline dehydrogenase-like flavoprotein
MGNTGWNWSSLWPYYLRSEHFIPPSQDLVAKGAAYEPAAHGTSGPLDVSFSPFMLDAAGMLNQTYNNIGIPYKKDQSDGDLHGFSVFPSTINSTGDYRADAARSYLLPIQGRPNLHIFNGTLADRILWSNNATNVTATGVQVRSVSSGAIATLNARREVILSAGSHKSPVILENSGIGNPSILAGLSIPVKVNLPSVGENLQDQPQLAVQAAANTTYGPYGYWPYVTYPIASEIFGSNTSNVAAHVLSRLPSYASSIAALTNNATTAAVVEKQLRIQTDLIFNKSVPCGEILTLPFLTSVDGIFWPLLPFSRGNTHITSRDPRANPRINPQFLIPGVDWDPISMAGIANLIRKAFRTAPLGPMVGKETMPNTTVVPASGSVADWMPFFTNNSELLIVLRHHIVIGSD